MHTKKGTQMHKARKPIWIDIAEEKEGVFLAEIVDVEMNEKEDSRFPGKKVIISYQLSDGRLYKTWYMFEQGAQSKIGQVVRTLSGPGRLDLLTLIGRECGVHVESRKTQDGTRDYYAVTRVMTTEELDEYDEQDDETPEDLEYEEQGYDAADEESDDEDAEDEEAVEQPAKQITVPPTRKRKISRPRASE